LQIVEEEDELAYGIDLLDPTKLLPEELVPVQLVGRMTLDRNPDNFFSETEQVAFCVSNVVPGIDFTNDPLMQARLFSYLDTQITRLGGPNFAEIPINRPVVPVRNHQQDGSSRQAIPTSRALYHPNSIAGNMPELAAGHPASFVHRAEAARGRTTRARSATFGDHFSQARLFLRSQSVPEREHLRDAFRFELAKVERLPIRRRVVALLRQVDEGLARDVATSIGVTLESVPATANRDAALKTRNGKTVDVSPALSLAHSHRDTIRTRKVAVLVAAGVRAGEVSRVSSALRKAGAKVDVIGDALGTVRSAEGDAVAIDKTLETARSVFYDAVFVPGGSASAQSLCQSKLAVRFVGEAYEHAKAIGATNEGIALLVTAGVMTSPKGERKGVSEDAGVVHAIDSQAEGFARALIQAIQQHRHFQGRSRGAPAASPEQSLQSNKHEPQP
jgi:catalase